MSEIDTLTKEEKEKYKQIRKLPYWLGLFIREGLRSGLEEKHSTLAETVNKIYKEEFEEKD